MNEELQRRIRQLVVNGKISSEEARQLADAMEEQRVVPATAVSATGTDPQPGQGSQARFLTIRVSGRQTVNLRIPLSLAQDALPFILKYVPADQLPSSVNPDVLRRLIERAAVGTLVEIETDVDHIVVAIE